MKADLIHATSEGELEDLRALGVKAPVAIIPNGVDLPRVLHTDVGDNVRRLLFLGRVHPKKGVDRLLKAWKLLAPKHPNWILEVVGPDNIGYKDRMKNFAEELALERVYFRDPVFGQEKERTYQQASLFVLPTRSDNFGIAVAEALANGVPAVVTKGAPWAGLETYDCGRWIDDQVEVIAGTLDEVMKLPEAKLLEMGNNGRRWVEEAFSWRSVAETMKKAYQWVLTGGERPPWIYI